jgi:hypothetical protein
MGRACGAGLVLGIRGAAGLQQAVGPERAAELLAACATKVCLLSQPPMTVDAEQGLVITAAVTTPALGTLRMVARRMDAEGVSLRRDPTIATFIERPRSELEFPGWDEDDEGRLGFVGRS